MARSIWWWFRAGFPTSTCSGKIALWRTYIGELASFARVILYDKRGTGLSDPVDGVPTVENRVDDLRTVMDAAGSERAALFGFSEGGPISLMFAATYPERVHALVVYGSGAGGSSRWS